MNFYAILELPPEATQLEIKQSFRRLAKLYHPDVNNDPDAERRFKLIYIAYDILNDAYKRSIYDELQLIRIAEETIRMRRWKRSASRRADQFADMEFENFENKTRGDIKFHTEQSIGIIFSFCILCLGFGGVLLGSEFVINTPGESRILAGCLMWLFGGALLFTGARAVLDVFKEWHKE